MDLLQMQNSTTKGVLIMEEMTKYSVYARTDANSKVVKILSSCFEQSLDTDILLKSGYGDEYVHVGYYRILNDDNTHRYCVDGGIMRECTEEELEEERASFPEPEPSDIDILFEIETDQEFRICCLEMGITPDEFE